MHAEQMANSIRNVVVALLNMYLMAIYGQHTNWVKGFYNNHIYLNRKAIEDAKLDLTTYTGTRRPNSCSEFSGVQFVATEQVLAYGRLERGRPPNSVQGTHHFEPGRPDHRVAARMDQSTTTIRKRKSKVIRNNAVITPLVFMGNGYETPTYLPRSQGH